MFGKGKAKKDKQFGETLGALSVEHATDENEITDEK